MAIDRQKQVDTIYGGHGILAGGIPYFYFQDKMRPRRSSAPGGSTVRRTPRAPGEAGIERVQTTLFYYEYFPEMSSQVQLASRI